MTKSLIKKHNLFFAFCLISTIFACSSSDDNSQNPVTEDPITGTWNFSKAVDFYNNTEYEFPADECSSQGQQIFDSNGNYSFTNYSTPDNECVNGYYSTSGTWNNINEVYEVSFEYECLSEDCDGSIPNVILIDNSTLRIQFNGEIVNGEPTEYYYKEYTKQ